MPDVLALILAAGRGTRMKSSLPKVLHLAAGRPLVHYPVRAALDAGADRVVVVTGEESGDAVEAYLARTFGAAVATVRQHPPRGTGDAVRVGLAAADAERTVVLCGDTPLVRADQLLGLLRALGEEVLTLLTCTPEEPTGYGRILRGADGRVRAIREQRDLTDGERALREVNAGVYAARTAWLRQAVARLEPNNAQGELYLTDVVGLAAGSGHGVAAVPGDAEALQGVNDRAQLAAAERALFRRIAERHGRAGVTLRGEAWIDDTVQVEADAVLECGVRLRGASTVGAGALIDVGAVVTDSVVAAGARVLPYSVLTDSTVAAGAQIGPFSHLRPGSVIDEDAHVGNFVETKKTRVRRGAKANHLAYLGDGDVGEGANVGAGTIFCNYDGVKKHRTVIGAGAFIGSDSQLVAPVTVGAGAYVATGTTVTRDVPDDALAIGRTRQENKLGYASRLRGRLKAQKPEG